MKRRLCHFFVAWFCYFCMFHPMIDNWIMMLADFLCLYVHIHSTPKKIITIQLKQWYSYWHFFLSIFYFGLLVAIHYTYISQININMICVNIMNNTIYMYIFNTHHKQYQDQIISDISDKYDVVAICYTLYMYTCISEP
jgi:hypothetical protein